MCVCVCVGATGRASQLYDKDWIKLSRDTFMRWLFYTGSAVCPAIV